MNNIRQRSYGMLGAVNRIGEKLRKRKLLWLLVLTVTVAYSALSILRHLHFTSGAYDLGIFDQAIWQYSRFNLPYTSVRSNTLTENLLGDHFHPILAVLAPLYWFTDNVAALLVAQALLFALAIVPLFLFTEKRLGRVAGYFFAISYSLFWGIQKSVEFDFHEIAFAVPMIAGAIYFVDEKRWTAYFVCIVLLLLTKENLSVLVVFFGVYLMLIKQFKRGLISIVAGIIWFLVTIKLLIPLLIEPLTTRVDRPGNYYRYWSYNQLGPDPWSALRTILTRPVFVIKTLFSPSVKAYTYWYIFYPFLFLAFFSPLFVLAVPLLAERFLSDGASRWITEYHYTATLTPILVMASADGLFRVTRLLKKRQSGRLIVAASAFILALNLFLLPRFPLWNLTSPEYWRLNSSDRIGQTAVSFIPPTASVLAQGPITPHLAHRQQMFVLNPLVVLPDCDFIITSERINPFPAPTYQDIRNYLDRQLTRGYRKLFEQDGWVVLKREFPTTLPLPVYNEAAFVEQSVPSLMLAGQTYEAQVTMRNTGYNPWTASHQYRLALLTGTTDWGLVRVELPATTEPLSSVKFSFKVTAPQAPGEYRFHWGMIQDGVQAFGEAAPEVSIKVVTPATSSG